MKGTVLLLLLWALAPVALGQEYLGTRPPNQDSLARKRYPTYNTSHNFKEKAAAKKLKKYLVLYARDPSKVLYGNPCVSEYTHQLGFEYIPQLSFFGNAPENVNVGLHNTWVRTKLLFRHGPGWRGRVKKRISQCKRSSGDFRG